MDEFIAQMVLCLQNELDQRPQYFRTNFHVPRGCCLPVSTDVLVSDPLDPDARWTLKIRIKECRNTTLFVRIPQLMQINDVSRVLCRTYFGEISMTFIFTHFLGE